MWGGDTMSKHTPNHKNYFELKIIEKGSIIDKVKIPIGELKKVSFHTKVKGTDKLFIVSETYAHVLEKYL